MLKSSSVAFIPDQDGRSNAKDWGFKCAVPPSRSMIDSFKNGMTVRLHSPMFGYAFSDDSCDPPNPCLVRANPKYRVGPPIRISLVEAEMHHVRTEKESDMRRWSCSLVGKRFSIQRQSDLNARSSFDHVGSTCRNHYLAVRTWWKYQWIQTRPTWFYTLPPITIMIDVIRL